MSGNEYFEVKELTKQIIQQYVMNQYPWGIITRPLTPVALMILSITYIITITTLILSFIQIVVLVRYSMASLRYVKAYRRNNLSIKNIPVHKLPFVSILIPIKNENVLTIKRNLENIASLNYPRELLEVLYISDDPEYYVNGLTKIIGSMMHKLGVNARIIRRVNNTGYKGGALNYGIKHAKGDVIAVFDVDTIMPSDYLMKAVNALLNGYDAITAVWKGYYTVDNVISRLLKFMYDVYNEVFIRGRFLSGGFPAITGNNLVIWRKVLYSVNGFCECTGEDLDLSIKLRSRGYKVGLIDSDVYCEVPYTYPSFKKQFSRWLFNSIWNMKHNLSLLITSNKTTFWEKIDGLLWMLQFPSMSFAALSILVTVILSIIGVLVPPISILFLEAINAIIVIPLTIILILISRRVGYGMWDFITNAVRSVLLTILMSFPMLAYSIESLLIDEWEWVPTPKGQLTHSYSFLKDLIHELLIILVLIAVMITLVLSNQVLTTLYIASILAILLYGFKLIIPHRY
ncbi:MAG: glycosyltransferase [Vulcanisaeta sp.]|uniref:glycosyltransferase n=1 Tax=Vulcanisaeta sp. TaxID=2020871 RepID=UPI003D0A594E